MSTRFTPVARVLPTAAMNRPDFLRLSSSCRAGALLIACIGPMSLKRSAFLTIALGTDSPSIERLRTHGSSDTLGTAGALVVKALALVAVGITGSPNALPCGQP